MPWPTFKVKFLGQELLDLIRQRQDNGDTNFEIRMFEMETAKNHGIPFDANWYSIPVYGRAVMIAGSIGRNWIDVLNKEKSGVP